MDYSVMYDWRLHGRVLPVSDRLTPIGQSYTLPNGMTPRRAVDCPAAATPVASASSARAPTTAALVASKPGS